MMIIKTYFYSTQDYSLVLAFVGVATIVLASLLAAALRRKRVRDLYPNYDEIPSTILTHAPTRKELEELDQSVDVVVRNSC